MQVLKFSLLRMSFKSFSIYTLFLEIFSISVSSLFFFNFHFLSHKKNLSTIFTFYLHFICINCAIFTIKSDIRSFYRSALSFDGQSKTLICLIFFKNLFKYISALFEFFFHLSARVRIFLVIRPINEIELLKLSEK